MRRLIARPILAQLYISRLALSFRTSVTAGSSNYRDIVGDNKNRDWVDDSFDEMDLSGVTIVRPDPSERERRAKTKMFIETLFRVPDEQEAKDMVWSAVANHKTLKPHHLAAMVNEARRAKYAWVGLREGSVTTASSSVASPDHDDYIVPTQRKARGELNLEASRTEVVPVAYPPARCHVCFTSLLEAGFVKILTEQLLVERGAVTEEENNDAEHRQSQALEQARIVCGRHVEGLLKLLLEEVLQERFSDDDDQGSKRSGSRTKAQEKPNLDPYSTNTATSVTNKQRVIEDAGAAWSLVSTMGRFGLPLSAPKLLDALDVMISAGVSDRLRYIDEGESADCPDLKKHKKISYQLAVANRADFIEEQRERLGKDSKRPASGQRNVRGEAHREPNDHRV